MRKLLFACVVLGLITPAFADDSAKLIGVWKMTSWTRHEIATGKDGRPLGEHPSGYLIYTKGGHFMWTGFKDPRPKPAGAEPTDAESVALFRAMYDYSGTYQVVGGKIVDTIEGAWNEGWVGRKFIIDKYEVSDKSLTMVTAPFKATVMDGAEMVVTTVYERVE
jgi:Lipocalin-like domain